MKPDELLKLYEQTGCLIWENDNKASVKWSPVMPTKEEVIVEVQKNLIPILHIASRELTKKWIKDAVNIVGHEKFEYRSAFVSEEQQISRNLFYNDVIEQINIMHAYHRKEQHKIGRIKKDFQKKRDKLTIKLVQLRMSGPEKYTVWTQNIYP